MSDGHVAEQVMSARFVAAGGEFDWRLVSDGKDELIRDAASTCGMPVADDDALSYSLRRHVVGFC